MIFFILYIKYMDYKSDIDELLEWINDSSKVLTKKQKKKNK